MLFPWEILEVIQWLELATQMQLQEDAPPHPPDTHHVAYPLLYLRRSSSGGCSDGFVDQDLLCSSSWDDRPLVDLHEGPFFWAVWAWASFRQMVTLHPKSGNREGWMLLFTYVMFGFNCWQCKIILHGSLSKDCLDSMGLWASLWRTVLVVLIEDEGLHTMGSTIPWAE